MSGEFPDWAEISQPYASHDDDRWVVVMVVSYEDGAVTSPEEAAAAALDITRDAGSAGTLWHVYDRHRRRTVRLQQQHFRTLAATEPSKRKAPDGTRFDMLGALLDVSEDDGSMIREAAHRAGLMWSCSCWTVNRVATSICTGCGKPRG